MILDNEYETEGTSAKILQPIIKEHKANYVDNTHRDEPQEVYPFKDIKDIEKIKSYFLAKKQYRNYALFTLGINTGLRCGDILNLKWDKVLDDTGHIISMFTVREEKTEKFRKIFTNKSIRESLTLLIEKENVPPSGYIFKSQRNDRLEVVSVYRMLKRTAKAVGITYNVGTHSMRKTWGYHQYITYSKNNPQFIYELQKMFGHSASGITLAYIGITDEKSGDYYNGVNL